jgi:hypothetical protein
VCRPSVGPLGGRPERSSGQRWHRRSQFAQSERLGARYAQAFVKFWSRTRASRAARRGSPASWRIGTCPPTRSAPAALASAPCSQRHAAAHPALPRASFFRLSRVSRPRPRGSPRVRPPRLRSRVQLQPDERPSTGASSSGTAARRERRSRASPTGSATASVGLPQAIRATGASPHRATRAKSPVELGSHGGT